MSSTLPTLARKRYDGAPTRSDSSHIINRRKRGVQEGLPFSALRIVALYVECAFFHGEALLDASTGTAFNVECTDGLP